MLCIDMINTMKIKKQTFPYIPRWNHDQNTNSAFFFFFWIFFNKVLQYLQKSGCQKYPRNSSDYSELSPISDSVSNTR